MRDWFKPQHARASKAARSAVAGEATGAVDRYRDRTRRSGVRSVFEGLAIESSSMMVASAVQARKVSRFDAESISNVW